MHRRLLLKIPKQLIDCLNESKVHYEILHHPEVVTAQRIAEAEHVKARHHAKVVMVKSGDRHLMTVLPADHQLDLEKVARAIGAAPRWTPRRNSSRSSRTARLEQCRPLAISMGCQRIWTRV
ncbi:MAG: hypothetical protein DMF34_11975 [Verrucomicrobia bacterium]|nr:MAG: hypothetical protein DMF34_11975 [Verrucomicrobiota bacterium]